MFNKQCGVSSSGCWCCGVGTERLHISLHERVVCFFALEFWAHGSDSFSLISGDSEDSASFHFESPDVGRYDLVVAIHWSQIGRAVSIDVAELDADNTVMLATL